MKNILLLFLFFLMKNFAAQNNSDANAPVIQFEKDTMDYGTVECGSNNLRTMKFTNTGKSPLIITYCTGACGCIVVEYPREPIMPGKSGFIKVHYDTKRPGPIRKYITVNSNAKAEKEVITKRRDETGKTYILVTKISQTGFPVKGTVLPSPDPNYFPSVKTWGQPSENKTK